MATCLEYVNKVFFNYLYNNDNNNNNNNNNEDDDKHNHNDNDDNDNNNNNIIPRFLKTGLAKISTHSTTRQFKTIRLIQRPIKNLYLTTGSKLMVPRSVPTSPNLK